jgi:hypothetical protein
MCHLHNIYAYDAYVLECAERFHVPLITLDSQSHGGSSSSAQIANYRGVRRLSIRMPMHVNTLICS